MKVKTVIADDEPIAREGLRAMLASDNEIEIVGTCRNGKEAIQILRSQKIDLLFLDIQMPGKDGFSVLKDLGPHLPLVIFVTAYEEHAVKAFEVCAVDYLVKAVNLDRLKVAVSRAKEKIQSQQPVISQEKLDSLIRAMGDLYRPKKQYIQRFLSRSGITDTIISADEITWIEAADYYVRLHVGNRSHMIRESIKHLESRLDPEKFVRLHRSAIVNVRFVKELRRESRSEGRAILSTGEEIRMNRNGWHRFTAMRSTL